MANDSPVVSDDGDMSDERLAQLLALRTEHPALDYKSKIDLTTTEGKVELAKDVGAMQVVGGYIVGGANDDGTLSGEHDGKDTQAFDQANLASILTKWLPEPLVLHTRVAEWKGHIVPLIYVGPNPAGCAFFSADGAYEKAGKQVRAFYKGEAFWRNGTRSERMSQRGLEEVVKLRVAREKTAWIEEQQQVRRREQAELESAHRAHGPLGSVNFDLEATALNIAALELVRGDDGISLQHLFNDAVARARDAIGRGEIEGELGDLLDKLTCLAATFLMYNQDAWFDLVIDILTQIYSMPLREGEADTFLYSVQIDPRVEAPRVWLQVIERVYGLGALAVRQAKWKAVRELTLQLPKRLGDYDRNWLRHAITMTSRSGHLKEQKGEQTVEISLLILARNDVARLGCLRPDGLGPEDDELLTSLAQFDVLSNLVAVDDAGADVGGSKLFYPNFARFYQHRVTPIVEQLLTDPEMRDALLTGDDKDLALALQRVGEQAVHDGWRFDGFQGWDRTPVAGFIASNLPPA